MRNPFAALAAADARRLWLAGLAVNVIRWLELLAFGLLALQLTGSAFWVAVMTVVRLLPLLGGAVAAAAIAGRSRQHVLLVIVGLLVLTDAVLLALAAGGGLELWHLLVAAFVGGLAWALETPVRRTLLAEAAGLARLHASMGLEVVSNQVTRIVGPALGGLLIDLGGVAAVFAIGAVVHAYALWLLATIQPDVPAVRARGLEGLGRNLAEGFAYVRRHRLLMGAVLLTAVFNFWGFPYVALAPVIGERVLALSPTGIGLLLATEAVGALIAAFVVIDRARPVDFGWVYAGGALLMLAGTLVFGLTSLVWVAVAALFLGGIGMAGFNAMQISLPLAATPPAIRVRVMGIVTLAIGAAPFGFLHAGLLAEWLGAATAQQIIAAEGLAASLLVIKLYPELLRREPPRPL